MAGLSDHMMGGCFGDHFIFFMKILSVCIKETFLECM